jgi:ATP-dependent RNA helicase RhlE
MTGTAFTLVSPEEEGDLRSIEKTIGRRLARVIVPDFDYTARPAAALEVPHAERIAAIRQRKREDRERARINAARRAAGGRAQQGSGPGQAPTSPHAVAARRPGTRPGRPGGWNRRGR